MYYMVYIPGLYTIGVIVPVYLYFNVVGEHSVRLIGDH